MRISDADASVLLSDDGRAILATVGIEAQPLSWIEVDIAESEDLGLWIRVERNGFPRALLLRWEYIMALDIQSVTAKPLGIRR